MGQLIISIGREFGSGGHEIAEKLAKHYDMPLYGRCIPQTRPRYEQLYDRACCTAAV